MVVMLMQLKARKLNEQNSFSLFNLFISFFLSLAAGLELIGLSHYFNTMEGVSFPLTALVDYRGFRLIAMTGLIDYLLQKKCIVMFIIVLPFFSL
jgi:hypothetical protein